MKDFSGKTAVITGAGSGMGRYLAVLLAKAGANVAICDINPDTLEGTASMVRQYNVRLSKHIVDMGDMEQVEALPEAVIEQHGAECAFPTTTMHIQGAVPAPQDD